MPWLKGSAGGAGAARSAGVFLAALAEDDTETAYGLLCEAERAELSPDERRDELPRRRRPATVVRCRRRGRRRPARGCRSSGPTARVGVDRHQRGRPARSAASRPGLTARGSSRAGVTCVTIVPVAGRVARPDAAARQVAYAVRPGTAPSRHAGSGLSSAEVSTVTQRDATKWVYDFSEGNKDQKDLLGGKGANLAEMTNLGLPVPPGFTITTDACRYYLEHGGTPPELDAAGHRAPDGAREGHGQDARRPGRPAAGLGPLGRRGVDARDDGDRPQRRPQRRVGAGPRRSSPATSASPGTPTAG